MSLPEPFRHRAYIDAILDNASVAVFVMDARQHCVFMNPAAEELTGFALTDTAGRPLHDVVHHTRPDGTPYPLAECPIDRAFPERARMTGEDVFVHKDGSFYPVAYTASPLKGADGVVTGTVIEVRALAAERAAQSEAAAISARMAGVLETMDEAVVTLDREFRVTSINREGLRLDGRPGQAIVGRTHWDVWPGSIGTPVEAAYRKAMAERAPVHLEHRYQSDTHDVWLEIRATPTPNGGLALFYRDIGERKRAETQRELLINELNHRVKNTLATVQALSAQTLRNNCGVAAFRDFEDRLLALSAAHDLLTATDWTHAGLADVAQATLAPYMQDGLAGRIAVRGPDVALPPSTALALSMAFHELATNAIKYGALSGTQGKVDLHWDRVDGRIEVSWRESGGPPVVPPSRAGFGTRLIERGLSADLGGRAALHFVPEGLVCDIVLPVRSK